MKFALVALIAAGVLAGVASAAKPAETRFLVKDGSFSIILPAKWYAVPREVSAVTKTIAALKKQKKTGLASEYSFYLTAFGKSELKDYKFQAFLDISPSMNPIPPQVAVQVTNGKYRTSDLPIAGNTFASSLAQNKGAKITAPKEITLPEGKAQFITGTIPEGTGGSDGFELYILVHKGKLYVLKFDIDATALASAKVFRSIAENVRFL